MQRANGERNTHGVRVCILHACILPPPPCVRAGRGGIGCPGVGARVRVFARAKERCARDVLARSARGHAWNPEQTIPSFVFPPIPSFPLSSSCLTACLPTYLPTYLPSYPPTCSSSSSFPSSSSSSSSSSFSSSTTLRLCLS